MQCASAREIVVFHHYSAYFTNLSCITPGFKLLQWYTAGLSIRRGESLDFELKVQLCGFVCSTNPQSCTFRLNFQNKSGSVRVCFNIHVFWLVRKLSRYLSALAAMKLLALPSAQLLPPLLSCNDPISTWGSLKFRLMWGNGNGNCWGYDLSQFDVSQCDLTLRSLVFLRFWQTANKTESKAFHVAPSLCTQHPCSFSI